MHRTLINFFKSNRNLLLVGALLGGTAAACDPKQIGDETTGNATCEDGEEKPADDGCNTCICEGGDWACTLKACEPQACEDGDEKPADDGCNTCHCDNGSWFCTEIGCEGWTEGTETESDTGTQEPNETESGTATEGPNETTTTTGTGVCGDGIIDGVEACDDGNSEDGDGCSSECTIEGGQALWCPDPAPADPFDILDAMIFGDTLAVQIQYSGGCVEHDFAYCWDGLFAESDPVQISTKISHDGKDDECDALPVVDLEFDLSDLKATWQASYQQQNGEIAIGLDGWPAGLDYVF